HRDHSDWPNQPYEPLDSVGYRGQRGHYTDPEIVRDITTANYTIRSPLTLLGMRYYDPSSACFLNRDPIGYEGGINVYAYTGNNPINAIDPSGLDAWDWIKGASKAGWNVIAGLGNSTPGSLIYTLFTGKSVL